MASSESLPDANGASPEPPVVSTTLSEAQTDTSTAQTNLSEAAPRVAKRRATQSVERLPRATNSFPTPFKCSGDFCGIKLRNTDTPSSSDVSGTNDAAKKGLLPPTALELLFSQDQRLAMTDDASRLLAGMQIAVKTHEGSSDDRELRIITYKSIALARGNKVHLVNALAAQERSKRYEAAKDIEGDQRKRKKSHLLDSTAAQQLREGSRSRVYGELDGVANYYRQVRVCGDCYAIYALLDLVREAAAGDKKDVMMRAHQMNKHRTELEQQWEAQVDKEVETKEKLYLRKQGKKRATTTVIELVSPSESGAVVPSENGLTISLPALYSPKAEAKSPERHQTLVGSENSTASTPVLLPSAEQSSGNTTLPPLKTPTNQSIAADTPSESLSSPATASPNPHRSENYTRIIGVERYLRGESRQIHDEVLEEGQLFRKAAQENTSTHLDSGARPKSSSRFAKKALAPKVAVARVLIICSDVSTLNQIHSGLEQLLVTTKLDIENSSNPLQALRNAQDSFYELVLVERDLDGSMSGLELAKILRQTQIQRSVTLGSKRQSAVICITSKTTKEDLQLYKDCGMDGCVGKPVNRDSLARTVQAALTQISSLPLSPQISGNNAVDAATEAIARAKIETQERRRQQLLQHRRRRQNRLEAANALSIPGIIDLNARDDYVHGEFLLDAATTIPYCVMGDPSIPASSKHNTFFNLVIVHDLFDTWERLQILLQPIIAKYNGAAQVLLWNYPGQAYTKWRRGELLNNEFHAKCLAELLKHVCRADEVDGVWRRQFRDAPYYLVGIGNGGSIATAFCTHSPPFDANTRALILVNAFSYVDTKLAQFLHDCLKVFACTPASRPDLPVYFHSRFLFSPSYLARVTAPMALNLYTAVMNPITLEGRIALCSGALVHRDLRDRIGKRVLRIPVVNLCSTQDGLINSSEQVESLLALAKVDVVDSLGKVLQRPPNEHGKRLRRSCVLWLASGHEVIQERKNDMLLLFEQLVTGFHEVNDVPHGKKECSALESTSSNSKSSSDSFSSDDVHRSPVKGTRGGKSISTTRNGNFEDTFINNVLKTNTATSAAAVPKTYSSSRQDSSTDALRNCSSSSIGNFINSTQKWTEYQQLATETAAKKTVVATNDSLPAALANSPYKKQLTGGKPTVWDPTKPGFERISANVVYKPGNGSKIYPEGASPAEVKEYMGWRIRRNQKRLQRMNQMATIIQRAFRAFAARLLLVKIKQERCAIMLQRIWRAKLARRKYHGMKKEDWAARLLQRHWRGKLGRDSYRDRMRKYLAAMDIQRIARGWLARQLAMRIRTLRKRSALRIQREIRRFLAVRRMFEQRRRRNGAITIQRVFRGHVGRRRFERERDKLLFSRTQSQGIAFGKQMLLEYKLFATKLQSEVALLVREKQDVERQAELVLKEICEFDEGIRLLEAEMHELSKVETESLTKVVDERGKWQIREQKMRLDREFAQMLAQIAQRREALAEMEEKLTKLDRERLQKEEELKALERKLVVLLEEQQQELARIKQKQQSRSQLALDMIPSVSGAYIGSAFNSPSVGGVQSPFPTSASASSPASGIRTSAGASNVHPAVANSSSAFTPKQREEANSLMESTETMMKFGFMSMSMTYFSSMNMVRAMRKIGAHHMTLDSAAIVSNKRWPEYGTQASESSVMGSPTSTFQPNAPPGSFPGQQPIQIAGWSVADVGRWLDTLTLGQYKRAFADASVDGALLLHLNDEDLKNTLGMEHRLHRKKILTSVEQLREAERVKMQRLYGGNTPDSIGIPSPSSPSRAQVPGSIASNSQGSFDSAPVASPSKATSASSDSEPARENVAGANLKVVVSFGEFCQLVRHGKLKQLKEALANVPDRKFDALTVMQPFASGVGTVYDDLLEKSLFHINKSDENGNSPLLLAAQNNNLKVAQLLLSKGANPNHQNKNGNTAGHYAMAYSFFDLGAWLLDPDKGGCRDDIVNESGLTAYDGLS